MRRSRRSLAALLICLVLALLAMIGLSRELVRLDRAELQARRLAALEENARLALWRMDSALAPLLYRENGRPTENYPTDPAPDPADQFAALVTIHFQVDRDGIIATSRPNAGQLEAFLDPKLLEREMDQTRPELIATLEPAPGPGPDPGADSFEAVQSLRNDNEWRQRAQNNFVAAPPEPENKPWTRPDPGPGYLRPIWLSGELLLVRRVSSNQGDYFQGCRLDWPGLKTRLRSQITDLLPEADLAPVTDPAVENRGRLLTSLPIKLEPGPLPAPARAPTTPVIITLVIAWTGLILAAAGGGFLLFGAITLSERRAAFVSAVTHELRTPLTTFKMYTEMLAEGMVSDPDQRRRYLETLRSEADRLGHLVENVLAYSRLERNRDVRIETVAADRLVEGVREVLSDRARQAGMALVVKLTAAPGVRADRAAVERVLYNLVDNACKYAAGASDQNIEIEVAAGGGKVLFKVRDHGPGVPARSLRRLFQPFSRPAEDAAGQAPGVGLGLALSRRLARHMGGDLVLDPGPGSCFILSLPAAP